MAYVTFKLVGMKAGDRLPALQKADVGSKVTLKPEPDNKFDPYAIAVHLGTGDHTEQIGYMPAAQARLFHLDGYLVGTISNLRWPPKGAPDVSQAEAKMVVGADISVEGLNNHRRSNT